MCTTPEWLKTPARLASLFILAVTAHGVSGPGITARQSVVERDSVDILERAQGAQARFERLRREHLPWTYSSSGRCDIRIGQYCFRFDNDEPAWDPPPEDDHIVEQRERLIHMLDSAQATAPGDEWLNVQLIRYLTEVKDLEHARDAVGRCLAVTWLCRALEGFVAHTDARYEDAEQAFERALQAMPAEQRCEWEDLSDLVSGDVRGQLGARECPVRRSLLDTLFWLADPLYLIPGNELRSEHHTRHVASIMLRQAKGPDPDGWNRSTHRITLRYGIPRGWQRIRGSRTELRPSLITHYGTDGAAFFFPKWDFVEDPVAIPVDQWSLDADRPQSNHDPSYAENGFERVVADFALFRHNDSTAVVTTAVLSHDSLSADTETRFAAFLARDPYHPPRSTAVTVEDTAAVLVLTGAPAAHLVSVEALATSSRVAGRVRHGLDLSSIHRDGLVASDILVLDPRDSIPEHLRDAVPHILTAHRFSPGDRFTLYWELYGLDRTNSLHSTTISLDKTSKGLFRRIAELTPFASHRPAVHVAWEEMARPNMTTVNRGLVVDLPEELSDGDYRLTLTVETPDGARVQRAVPLEVRQNAAHHDG